MQPPSGCVRIGLLDGFTVSRDGEQVRLPLSAQRLIGFLSLAERPLLRVYVAGTLWIDSSEEHAHASLRTTLWRVQRLRLPLIQATSTHIALEPSVQVDLREATLSAQRALRRDEPAQRKDLEELGLARELLPDWYDDWVVIERERARQLRLHALEALCDGFVAQADFGAAIEAGLLAVDAEPLRESAHRAVVRAHVAQGNGGEALRQYRLFRDLLRSKLGLEPSAQMEALVESLTDR